MIATQHILRIAIAAAAFLIGHSANSAIAYLFPDTYFHVDEKCHSELIRPTGPAPVFYPRFGYSDREISGKYYLFDEAFMKGFPDFDSLEIQTTDDDGVPVPVRGSVHATMDHSFVSVSFNRDRFEFETEIRSGIGYRFNGTVDEVADSEDQQSGRIIRGEFNKIVEGKIVGSMYTTFYPGGC